MTIKGKEHSIIIFTAAAAVITLAIFFFIRLENYHNERDIQNQMAARTMLTSFTSNYEQKYEQASLLLQAIEREAVISLKSEEYLTHFSRLEEVYLQLQSIIPSGTGFFIYFLNENKILSSFAEPKDSRDFFTSYFFIKNKDPFDWRNEIIAHHPVYQLQTAQEINIASKKQYILPVYHTIEDPPRPDTSAAIACVFINPETLIQEEGSFPIPEDGRLVITNPQEEVLFNYGFSSRGKETVIEQISTDGKRIYRMFLPARLFSHRTTMFTIFLMLIVLLLLIFTGSSVINFYVYKRKRLRTIHKQFETFSKKGNAARFMDQVLIENSSIANSFVIRSHMEKNYFLQKSVFAYPPGPAEFQEYCSQYDIHTKGKYYQAIRITIDEAADSYRRKLRTLALQELLEELRSGEDLQFDEAPGTTALVLTSDSEPELNKKRKQIIHQTKTQFKYISFYCGRTQESLLTALYLWFETKPGWMMKKKEMRVHNFHRDDKSMLYYYPAELEFALCNGVISGNTDAVKFICSIIEEENFTDKFTGECEQSILFNELDTTITKIQINSTITGAPQAETTAPEFCHYQKLFTVMAEQAAGWIDKEPKSGSDN